MKYQIIMFGLLLSFPFVASAATLQIALLQIGGFIEKLTPIVVAIAVLIFFWGLAMYILKTGEPEGREGARSMMIWGVIVLFVMIAVFGLINLLSDTFRLDKDADVDVPTIDVGSRTGS